MTEVGRNNPCHCGSGKKYKKCHLEKDEKVDSKKRLKASLNAAKVAQEQEKKAQKEATHPKDQRQNWLNRVAQKVPFFKKKITPSTRHK
ncbi:hypothetical protein BVX98_00505 [bacterium F11]|nr:hypothetical protein BVX98_00505 [bacterium F11]